MRLASVMMLPQSERQQITPISSRNHSYIDKCSEAAWPVLAVALTGLSLVRGDGICNLNEVDMTGISMPRAFLRVAE
jgi:hypothetical protein